MMINRKFLLVGVVALTSCGKSSNGGGAAATTTTSAAVSSDVTSLKDLSLTSVLSISLPTSVKGTGTSGLRLADANKSFEACKLRQEMREGLSNIAEASTMLCYIQNDPSLKFGTKYNIDFSAMSSGGGGALPEGGAPSAGGATPPAGFDPSAGPTGLRLADGLPDSMQIWIDNSVSGKLNVYMCQDKKLTQMIEVSAAKKGQAKGKIIMKQSMTFGDFTMNFHRAMNFDSNYTTEGKTLLTLKELVGTSSTQFGSEKARRLLALSLADTGVSKVFSSFSGNSEGSENNFSSVGAFDASYGSVIAKGSFKPNSGEAIEFSNESFFDGSSLVVDPIAYPAAFGEGGNVVLATSDLPGYLSSSFAPEEFPSTAWDCSGTTDLTLDMTSSSGTSSASTCSESWDELKEEDCSAGAFAEGEPVTIDPSTLPNADSSEISASGSITGN